LTDLSLKGTLRLGNLETFVYLHKIAQERKLWDVKDNDGWLSGV